MTWETKPLGRIANLIMGQSPESRYYNDNGEGMPFLQGCAQFGAIYPMPEVYCSAPLKIAPKGSILFSVRAPVGDVNVADTDYCIGRGVAAIVPKAVDDQYLHYYLRFIKPEFERKSQGSTFSAINSTELDGLEVYLPVDEHEQSTIAAILATVDHAIEQTKALIAKYQRIKTGLMHDLLTHGIDKHGQLRDPATHKFKPSPLGMVPEEWEISSVKSELEIASGFSLGQHRHPKLHPRKYLRVANVQRGRILLDDIAELEAEEHEFQSRILRQDDLLVVEGHADPNEIGRCAKVPLEGAGLTFQNHLFRLRCNHLDPRFALAWLNSEWVRAYWRRNCGTSSGLNTINRTLLESVLVPVPGAAEQDTVSKLIDIYESSLRVEEVYLEKFQRLKTGLMQDLLTGKVSVVGLIGADPSGLPD